MNVSFNFFKYTKKNNIFKYKKYLLALPVFYGLKNYVLNTKKANCYAENSDEPSPMDFNDMYADFDESDFANMSMQEQVMNPEQMKMMRDEVVKQQVTPQFSFARIPQLFMSPNDDKWNGLRFSFDWKPTKMYSLEYTGSATSFRRLDNYRLSCLNIVPNTTDPQLANVFVGRVEDSKTLFLRSQFMFTPKDRIEVNSQWGKPDANAGIHIFEYNRKFDRLDFTLKLSQYENSISLLATAYKNLFLGMEAIQIQGTQFLYRYGAYYKYNKNFSCGAVFNDRFTDMSLHAQYAYSRYWQMLFNYTKSDNPYMKQMGMDLDINMSHTFKYGDNTTIGVDVNYLGKIHGLITYKLNKYIELQGNLEVGPLYKAKFSKDLFKGLGFGCKLTLDRFEELMKMDNENIEEDLSEYKIE